MILKNCRLIASLTGGISSDTGYVEIEEGTIKFVSEEAYTGDEESVDCQGKTLLPGLIDLHTHIPDFGGAAAGCAKDPMQVLIEAADQAAAYLDYGFTTVRDCGSIGRSASYVREMIGRGLVQGPDVLACGNILMPSVIDEESSLALMIRFCDGEDAFRKGVREEVSHQADFIKIYASGSAFNPKGEPKNPIMTRKEIVTAVETARANDLYVAAHCHADSAIRSCIESGVRTIEHGTYMSRETIELLCRTEEAYLVPTMAAMFVSQTDPEERAFWLKRLNPMLTQCASAMEAAYLAGARIGFGTDCVPKSVQYEKGIEFQMRKENCHMQDQDILLQATKNSAEIAGISDRVGEILPGLAADLILVDGKPDQDISAMYKKPEKVWKKGRLYRA